MRLPFFSKPVPYRTIDESTGKIILDLHRAHPEMGRRRLFEASQDAGLNVNRAEFKRFLQEHKIGTRPYTTNPRFSPTNWPWLH